MKKKVCFCIMGMFQN